MDFMPPKPPLDHLLSKEPVRLVGPDGKPLQDDAGFLLGHQRTFSAIWSNVAQTYHWQFDEAIKHSQTNALAMRRDAFIRGCLQERYLQIAMLSYHLEPEDQKSQLQKLVSDEISRIAKNTNRWTQFAYQHAEAIWYGRYANQVKWAAIPINGKKRLAVVDHRPVNGDKIHFDYDGVPLIMVHSTLATKLINEKKIRREDMKYGGRAPMIRLRDPRWRERFIIHKHNCEDADFFEGEMAGGVHGVGVRSLIYWNFWLRDEMLGWAVNHLKKIGVGGILVFYYDEGNVDSKTAAENAASDAGERYAIAMPRPRGSSKDTNNAELLAFNESGVSALQNIIEDYFERHIERLIIGQPLSSKTEATGMGSSVAEFHETTKFQILKYDANNYADSLNADFVPVIQKWNFPNANFMVKLVFDVPDPKADAKLKAAGIAFQVGAEIKKSELLEASGFSQPEADDDVVSQLLLQKQMLELQLQAQIQGQQAQLQMQQQAQAEQMAQMQQGQGMMPGQDQTGQPGQEAQLDMPAGAQQGGMPQEQPAQEQAQPDQQVEQAPPPEPIPSHEESLSSPEAILKAMSGDIVDDVPKTPDDISEELNAISQQMASGQPASQETQPEGNAEHQPVVKEEAGFTYAATHAPAGGVTIGGQEFAGGQFIPGSVVARATPEEKAALAGKKAAAGERVPAMPPAKLEQRLDHQFGPVEQPQEPSQEQPERQESSTREMSPEHEALQRQVQRATDPSVPVVSAEDWDKLVLLALKGDGKKLPPLAPEEREPVINAMKQFIGLNHHDYAVAQGKAFENFRAANRTNQDVYNGRACDIISKYRGARMRDLRAATEKAGMASHVESATKHFSRQVEKVMRNPKQMQREVNNSMFVKAPILTGINAQLGFDPADAQKKVNDIADDEKRARAQKWLDLKKTATAFLANHAGELAIHAVKTGIEFMPRLLEMAMNKKSKGMVSQFPLRSQSDEYSMAYEDSDESDPVEGFLRQSFKDKLAESGMNIPEELADEIVDSQVAQCVPIFHHLASMHGDNQAQESHEDRVHAVAMSVTGDAMINFMKAGHQIHEDSVREIALWLRDRIKNRVRRGQVKVPEVKLEDLATEEAIRIAPAIVRALDGYGDQVHGGRADNVPESNFDQDQLRQGTEHETEHTDDRRIASEIARDHLVEDPRYYDHLKAIENNDQESPAVYFDDNGAMYYSDPEEYADALGNETAKPFLDLHGNPSAEPHLHITNPEYPASARVQLASGHSIGVFPRESGGPGSLYVLHERGSLPGDTRIPSPIPDSTGKFIRQKLEKNYGWLIPHMEQIEGIARDFHKNKKHLPNDEWNVGLKKAIAGPAMVMADHMEEMGHPHAEHIRNAFAEHLQNDTKPAQYGGGAVNPDTPDGFIRLPK